MAPLASVTVPRMLPVICCPAALTAANIVSAQIDFRSTPIVHSLSCVEKLESPPTARHTFPICLPVSSVVEAFDLFRSFDLVDHDRPRAFALKDLSAGRDLL